jgi:hypothetical protein
MPQQKTSLPKPTSQSNRAQVQKLSLASERHWRRFVLITQHRLNGVKMYSQMPQHDNENNIAAV